MNQMRLAALICLVVGLFLSSSVKADTVYTYTGQPFVVFNGPDGTCPPVCNLSGSLTLSSPLPPNSSGPLDLANVLNFSFTDGNVTINESNLYDAISSFNYNTNNTGQMWYANYVLYSYVPTFLFSNQLGGDHVSVDDPVDGYYTADSGGLGTWTTSAVTTPEPSSLLMLGLGAFALLGFKKFFA
jgi:hypothetical protein